MRRKITLHENVGICERENIVCIAKAFVSRKLSVSQSGYEWVEEYYVRLTLLMTNLIDRGIGSGTTPSAC